MKIKLVCIEENLKSAWYNEFADIRNISIHMADICNIECDAVVVLASWMAA